MAANERQWPPMGPSRLGQPLRPLPAAYTKFHNFVDVFGSAMQVMQCAEVQHRTEREWLRLAGRRCGRDICLAPKNHF